MGKCPPKYWGRLAVSWLITYWKTPGMGLSPNSSYVTSLFLSNSKVPIVIWFKVCVDFTLEWYKIETISLYVSKCSDGLNFNSNVNFRKNGWDKGQETWWAVLSSGHQRRWNNWSMRCEKGCTEKLKHYRIMLQTPGGSWKSG